MKIGSGGKREQRGRRKTGNIRESKEMKLFNGKVVAETRMKMVRGCQG